MQGTLSSGDRKGSRLGDYEIGKRLGSGGMGEVYRARDVRLQRDVALKILPEESAADPARLRRFEREARAASALSHPNIVTVYEVGSAGPVAYIAMELVEGRTLRELTAQGPLPLKSALDIACQVSSGLARAHDAGIVHRDLKPENVMVSKEGVAKILDFGLAKRMPFEADASSGETTLTNEGSIVGTVSYMSPEQAAGEPVSFRSDQYSFGSVLYELLTGRKAFQKKSSVETLSAIINENPEPIETANPKVPGPVRWIVERCQAKRPSDRYASTEDLARELRVVSSHLADLSGVSAAATVRRPDRVRPWGLLAIPAALALLAAVFLLGRRSVGRPMPDFQRLTFARGAVVSARFVPDGRTVVYGATWEGGPIQIYAMRTDGRDSTRLGELGDADILSVSSLGEIAMLLKRPFRPINSFAGTLARAPLAGGAPREMAEDIVDADWSPDGKALAIARKVGGKQRIEFPPGKVLHETSGWIEALRFSPGGDRIAFLLRGEGASVEVVDLAGAHRVLSRGWKRATQRGLAWSANGSEIWFTVNESGWRTPLRAVTPSGRERLVLRLPNFFRLEDVSRDGRVLVSLLALRTTMRALAPGESVERDLSWHEASLAKAITPDGKTLLFDEGNEGYFHTIYVRPTDGSPAKRIGEGRALAISPDGKWVVANSVGRGSPLVLLPVGAGEPKALESEGHRFEEAAFFPDGGRLLLLAIDPGRPERTYVMDLQTSELRPVGPEGSSCLVVSPNGKEVACAGGKRDAAIYPVKGGGPRPIPGFRNGEEMPLMWSSDGNSLFVGLGLQLGHPYSGNASSLKVFRLDLVPGKRQLWREFVPPDRAAVHSLYNFAMTPDGRSYASSYLYSPSDLYLVTGLK